MRFKMYRYPVITILGAAAVLSMTSVGTASEHVSVSGPEAAACNFLDMLAMKDPTLKTVKVSDIIAARRASLGQVNWTPGGFTLAGRTLKVEEGSGGHITLGECFNLQKTSPINNKVLLFKPVSCDGSTSKWGPGYYTAVKHCKYPNVYTVKNANVAEHHHTVRLLVKDWDSNGVPSEAEMWFEIPEDDPNAVIFDHPGNGSLK